MSRAGLADLSGITRARYQAEQAGLQDVLSEERQLRSQIADLELHHANTHETQRYEIGGHKQLGGDVMWQAWVSRARRSLQIQLAQVLVRKNQKLQQLNLAHGRKLAAEELAQAQTNALHKVAQERQAEQEQLLNLLKTYKDL